MPQKSPTRAPTPLTSIMREPDAVVSPAQEASPGVASARHPYRGGGEFAHPREAGLLDRGDLITYWTFVLLGLVPVLPTVLRGGVWGAEPSLGLLVIGFAGRFLMTHYGRLLCRAIGRAS